MTLNTFASIAAIAADSALPPLDPMPDRILVLRERTLAIEYTSYTVDDFVGLVKKEVSDLPAGAQQVRIKLDDDGDSDYSPGNPCLRVTYNEVESDKEYTERCQELRYEKARTAYDANRKIEAAKETLRAAGITNLE